MNRESIPATLAAAPRWVERTAAKHAGKGWNDPENWRTLDQINGDAMFIITDTDYLIIDADHVADENGRLYADTSAAIRRIIQAGKRRPYIERSVSGRGRHIVYDMSGQNFPPMANGRDQVITFPDHPEAKLELWYHVGHSFYLTGDKVVSSGDEAPAGSAAAAAMKELQAMLQEQNGTGAAGSPAHPVPESEQKRLQEALQHIPCADCSYDDWLHVGMALYNAGILFEVWDAWSATDAARYSAEGVNGTRAKWRSFTGGAGHWNAGTVYKMAKRSGWKDAAADFSDDAQTESTGKGLTDLRPGDFSDLGQAALFADRYGEKVRYSAATGFLVYDGRVWNENDLNAQRMLQKLTDAQMQEALRGLRSAQDAAALAALDDEGTADAKKAEKDAKAFFKFALERRRSAAIGNTLKEARPMLQIKPDQLDADAYLLNTPAGTVDLRTGETKKHSAGDYCTKITGAAPGDEGRERWRGFLQQVTGGDAELQDYLQIIAGLCAIGNSDAEKLIIAYGSGGNGKSTLFNLWYRVLGSYSGTLPADSLIIRRSDAKDYSRAELRGKRLVIAAELREGTRLSTDAVKALCSADEITAERKYRDVFSFRPSHSLVLYTNHLPAVGTLDRGTWDRIIVIPFCARFRDTAGEIKNYADVLFDRCGGAVLQWIIDGAVKYYSSGGRITAPAVVREALDEYREGNDWLKSFLNDRCEIGKGYKTGAGALYNSYSGWCEYSGEFKKRPAEFREVLIQAGFRWHRTEKGRMYSGLKLKEYTSGD